MIITEDQMGREVRLMDRPRRVISLVPSITEYLIDIGVEVVGRTKFCIHPDEVIRNIKVVGGTKKFRYEVFDLLKPDLIVGNKEENYQEGIEWLSARYPVWMSDVNSVSDALDMMNSLGNVLQRNVSSWLLSYERKLDQLQSQGPGMGKVLYLIWKDPWMAVGRETYINALLECMGVENVIKENRYPILSQDDIGALNPDTIFLSSEPYPFKSDHVEQLKEVTESKLYRVNGEFFSWYGSRITKLKVDDLWI